MTSLYGDEERGPGLAGAQEELDFSELFEYEPVAFDGNQDEPPLGEKPKNGTSGCEYLHAEAEGQADPSGAGPTIEITLWQELYQHRQECQDALPGGSYRELCCLSPPSSNSSASWHSDVLSPWVSPCVSPTHAATDLSPRFQAFHTGSVTNSPSGSPSSSRPSSRSTSPQGKRTYDVYEGRSRSPSPHRSPAGPLNAILNGPPPGPPSLSVPPKIVKSNLDYHVYGDTQPGSLLHFQPPGDFVVAQMAPLTLCDTHPDLTFIPVSALPPLEMPLPSCKDQYELRLEVEPRPHHRAHYETEGSRGAVKATPGGHPVVQLHGYRGRDPLALQIYIGTADERVLKPHAFYQVHRITGKTVTTVCYEKTISGTKVLEVPLEPKKNMSATIDCAGILKLKNSDIELRKGETDIGRKNTRVRLVFRVHIPQPNGQLVSLQVASQPVECSQRSAHELPMVEKQDADSCSVLGGQQMILTGQNFTTDSKVIFTEKTRDGEQIWETEATVDKSKSQANMLFVEVPAYNDLSVGQPVKVNFYVINGKRKRSQPQHFTYTPLSVPVIKTEPLDEFSFALEAYQHHTFYQSPCGLFASEARLVPPYQHPLCGVPGPQDMGPAVAYPRRSQVPGLYQQVEVMLPEACQASPSQHGNAAYRLSPVSHATAAAVPHGQAHAYGDYQQQRQQPPPRTLPKARPLSAEIPTRHASVPEGVAVKQESLDQVYLDDVNEIIRKDLTVHGRGQT